MKKGEKEEEEEHDLHAAPPRAAKNKRSRLTRCRVLIEVPPESAQIVPGAPQHESLADYADERVGFYMASSSSSPLPLIRLQPACKDPFEQMPRLHNISKQSMRHE